MDDFLKRYILIRNSLVKIFPALIFSELVGKNTCETCAEGFCVKNFCLFLIFYSLCYKIKETSRRNFNIVICYFDPQNRFPLEKLSIFKKKSMSIRISVQKLFNILGFVIFRWRTYTKSVMCGSNSVWDIPPTQNFTFFAKRKWNPASRDISLQFSKWNMPRMSSIGGETPCTPEGGMSDTEFEPHITSMPESYMAPSTRKLFQNMRNKKFTFCSFFRCSFDISDL